MPIVPASEGARNISKRGRTEMTHEAREQRTIQQSKSKEAQKNHQAITVAIRRHHRVSAPRRDAARDTNHQTYSHSNPPRIYHKDGGQDFFFTRARQHRYENKIESRGDSTILFFRSSVPSTSLLNLRSLYFLFRPAVKQRERSRRSSAEMKTR